MDKPTTLRGAVPQVNSPPTKNLLKTSTALKAFTAHQAELRDAKAESGTLIKQRARISREQASAIRIREARGRRELQANTEGLIDNIPYETPVDVLHEMVALDQKIAAFPVALQVLVEKQAAKQREIEQIENRMNTAAVAYTSELRTEICEKFKSNIASVAEYTSALVANHRLQKQLAGETFQFSGAGEAPDLWSGEVVALAFINSLPNRLRPPQLTTTRIMERAAVLFSQQQRELSK